MGIEANGNIRLSIQVLTVIFMAFGGWFAKEVYDGQKEIRKESSIKFDTILAQIAKLDKDAAVVTSSRFSSTDWFKAKETLDTRSIASEQRITKLEDTMIIIVEKLSRIENKITK
jgi:hypothetical protein